MKRVFPILLIFLGLIPSCCPEVVPFYVPGSLESDVFLNKVLYADIEDAEITSADGLELWLSFEDLEYIAESSNYFALQSTCYATQPCPEDGHRGLKSPVSSVKITSTAEFQSIEAGEDISEHFHVLEFVERDDDNNPVYNQESISTQLDFFNYLTYSESYVEFHFSELPGNTLEHTFTVELSFEDGSTMSSSSVPVQF